MDGVKRDLRSTLRASRETGEGGGGGMMKGKPRFLQDGLHGGSAPLARDGAGPPRVLAILLPTVRYCYRDLKNLCICPQTYRYWCFVSLSRFIFSFSI